MIEGEMMRKSAEKLTPYQLTLLERIKNSPTPLQITNWYGDQCRYTLLGKGADYESIKTGIGYPWHELLRAFFQQVAYKDSTAYYSMRDGAEISNEWMLAELQRQANAKADVDAIRAAEIEVEHQAAIAYLNKGSVGSPFSAELSGALAFGGSIFFDGKEIAKISPSHYSTDDKTFADLLKRPDNVEHFKRIRRMIVAANKGVAL